MGMLVLKRTLEVGRNKIFVDVPPGPGGRLTISVLEVQRGLARIGLSGPLEFNIVREELEHRKDSMQ